MGLFRKQDNPVHVDGQLSIRLEADRGDDAAEGWQITERPYRPRSRESLLDDLGSEGGACCVLAGNRILLADGSLVAVETLRPGQLVATMSGPAPVLRLETTRLGLSRKVIELRGTGDQCLVMTDDHPLWVSRTAGAGERREGWGTYNLAQTMYESRQGIGLQFDVPPTPLWFDLPEQVAHAQGWLHVRPIFHAFDAETTVYHVVVDGAFSFFAEGFALLSHTMNAQGPAAPWQGLQADAGAARFVDGLGALA